MKKKNPVSLCHIIEKVPSNRISRGCLKDLKSLDVALLENIRSSYLSNFTLNIKEVNVSP
jgi:hypothetical protein